MSNATIVYLCQDTQTKCLQSSLCCQGVGMWRRFCSRKVNCRIQKTAEAVAVRPTTESALGGESQATTRIVPLQAPLLLGATVPHLHVSRTPTGVPHLTTFPHGPRIIDWLCCPHAVRH